MEKELYWQIYTFQDHKDIENEIELHWGSETNNKKLFVILLAPPEYSGVPITQAGCNKQAGWIFPEISLNEQVVLSEQGGIY